jgi:hypothetical protein
MAAVALAHRQRATRGDAKSAAQRPPVGAAPFLRRKCKACVEPVDELKLRRAARGGNASPSSGGSGVFVGAAVSGAERHADAMATRALGAATLPATTTDVPATAHAEDIAFELSPLQAARLARLRSGGAPLSPDVRNDMQRRFGADFGRVRLHADADSAALAHEIHAEAFAYGEHVVLGGGPDAPATSPRQRGLLAHELAHVVQNQRSATPQARAHVRRALLPDLPGIGDIASGIAGGIREGASAVASGVSGAAEAAQEAVSETALAVVERLAPQLLPIMRMGPINWLRETIRNGFQAVMSVIGQLVPGGAIGRLIGTFGSLLARAGNLLAALAAGDCEPLLAALRQLRAFAVDLGTRAWDGLVEFIEPVAGFFRNLWQSLGAPALEALQQFGGDLWARIQQFGEDLWNWTAPIRAAGAALWGEVRELLFGGGGAEDSGGIVSWVQQRATEAWESIKEQTRPAWQPVADLAGRLAAMIPPPFVAELGDSMQGLAGELDGAAGALEAEGSAGASVAHRPQAVGFALRALRRVMGSVRRVIGNVRGAAIGAVDAIASGVTFVIEALRANPLLSPLAGGLGWLSEGVAQLSSWAQTGVTAVFDVVLGVFDAATPFAERVVTVAQRLVGIALDIAQLPLLIASRAWNAVPGCIREPVQQFLVTQILARIPVFGQFFTDPDLWPRVRDTALAIIRRIFVDGDIAGAAWRFFRAALGALGVPLRLATQILGKAARAVGDVLRDPLGFLGNLLRALRAGFGQFFGNVAGHLLRGLADWLFGAAREAGIEPPSELSLRGILGFVLQVLGLTAQRILDRLARVVGAGVVDRLRRMLDAASGVWSFVRTLATEGPAGLWRELRERLSGLWDTLVGAARDWVITRIVGRAARWLMSLLDVTGIMPVVNAFIAVYNAIESFFQQLRRMLEIVSRFLDGALDIARGGIASAAGYLEDALARALPVAIGFLANQLGLGRIGERLGEMLSALRERVDAALDWLIERAIRLGGALLDMARRGAAAVGRGVGRLREWWRARFGFRAADGTAHTLYFAADDPQAELMLASRPQRLDQFLGSVADVTGERAARKQRAEEKHAELRRAQRAAAAERGEVVGTSSDAQAARIAELAGEIAAAVAPLLAPAATAAGTEASAEGPSAEAGEPCAQSLPIRWPIELPLPESELVRVRSGAEESEVEADDRGAAQRRLREHIEAWRAGREVAPPLCHAADFEEFLRYDAHHRHPLYLGGRDQAHNLCALETDRHQRGHRRLEDQRVMAEHHPVWLACRARQRYLRYQPANQHFHVER